MTFTLCFSNMTCNNFDMPSQLYISGINSTRSCSVYNHFDGASVFMVLDLICVILSRVFAFIFIRGKAS